MMRSGSAATVAQARSPRRHHAARAPRPPPHLPLKHLTDAEDSGAPRRLRLPKVDGIAVAAGLVAIALFVAWAMRNGGTDPADWLLGALLLIGVLTSVVIGSGGLPRRLGRVELTALGALASLTVWAFASITWADVPGDAWNGADRMLLYLVVFSLFLLLRWRAASATGVLAAYVLGVAAVAVVSLVRASSGSLDLFLAGRLSYPTGYPNANAALFLSAFWVALVLATRRSTPVPLRVGAAMAATLLPQAALLSQSRGTLVAFPVTALVLLLVLPGRIRTAAGIIVSLVVTAATWGTHVAVFDRAQEGGGPLETAVGRSGTLIAVTVVVVALATLAWALVDRRTTLSERQVRLLDRSALAAGTIALVIAAAVVASQHPVERLRNGWDSFTAVAVADNTQAHFSIGLGSNRYDFWRVAMSRFEARPLTGIGADNFAVDYLRERRSIEEPTYPHSLEVMMLSQFGLVGGILLAAFVLAAGIAALPRHRDDPAVATAAGAALAAAVYFFVHASADWFWEIPALGAPAVALLALAMSVRACATGVDAVEEARAPVAATGIALALATIAAVACALPWLSHRQIDQALAVWRSDPESAFTHLERARSLDRLSAHPDLVAGVIAARLDDRARMPVLFARSLTRNPHSWYAQLELGLAQSVAGRQQAAVAAVRRAIGLNPREPLLQDVVRRLRQGEVISPSSLDTFFLERIEARTR